jgi:adenosylhomocysteine nucleosidase
VDDALLAHARAVVADVVLDRCRADDTCLQRPPKVVIGSPGVSGGAFIDNAAFREYTFKTFGARVLDMESAAVAHVAYANKVPFIAVRSLSDLAGGGQGENEIEVFLGLAAGNSAAVVKALLRAIPE